MVKCLGQGHDLCSRYQSFPVFQSFFNLSSNQSSHGPRLWRLDQERIKFLLLLFHDVPPRNSCFMVPSWNIRQKTHTLRNQCSLMCCVCVCVYVSWGWYRAYFQVPGQWQSASLKWVGKTTTWWLRIGGCSFWWAFISVNERGKSKLCKRMV